MIAKKLRTNLLLFAVSMLASLGAAEALLAWQIQSIKPYHEAVKEPGPYYAAARSPYLPFTTPRNLNFRHKTTEFDVTYHLNRHGYRGDWPRSIRKPGGRHRLLLLGDSFTLGWGNPEQDSYAGRLQQVLAPGTNPRWEVINAGYKDAYSPGSYYAYLVREGMHLSPNAVIVFLYSDNDVNDVHDNVRVETDERGGPLRVKTRRNYGSWQRRFLKKPEERLTWNYRVPYLRESRVFIGLTDIWIRLRRPPKTVTEGDWRRFSSAVNAIEKLSSERGVPVLWVLLPAPPVPSRLADQAEKHRRTREIVERFAVQGRVLDLQGVLASAHFFPIDGHLNKHGNRVVADAVLARLHSREDRLV